MRGDRVGAAEIKNGHRCTEGYQGYASGVREASDHLKQCSHVLQQLHTEEYQYAKPNPPSIHQNDRQAQFMGQDAKPAYTQVLRFIQGDFLAPLRQLL
jgi:hypothetical protein